MAPRLTTAELRERIDGLALAFFALTGVMLDALVEIHPDGSDALVAMQDEAYGLLLAVEDWPKAGFSPKAVRQALRAATAAFGASVKFAEMMVGEADADDTAGQ